jgi:hypothetical protein
MEGNQQVYEALGVSGNQLEGVIAEQNELKTDYNTLLIWAATNRAADGRVLNEYFGNGLRTTHVQNEASGLITGIETYNPIGLGNETIHKIGK